MSPREFLALEKVLKRFILEPPGAQQRLLEESCLIALAKMFVKDRDRSDLTRPARLLLVRRAEEFLRARLNRVVGEMELCAELGVSGRSLRLAFKEMFGMSAIAYHQILRLHAIRDVLKTAESEAFSIGQIASRFGFEHAGKFSGYYRRQFGELPSQTRAETVISSPP